MEIAQREGLYKTRRFSLQSFSKASKPETGKDLSTHEDVKEWHYFVNDIYFAEYDSNKFEPYRVTINVKEKADGSFVYSFSAEKNNETITPRTLHAAVKGTESSPNNRLVDNSISQTTEKSNSSDEKFLKERSVLPDSENSETSENVDGMTFGELLGEEGYQEFKDSVDANLKAQNNEVRQPKPQSKAFNTESQ